MTSDRARRPRDVFGIRFSMRRTGCVVATVTCFLAVGVSAVSALPDDAPQIAHKSEATDVALLATSCGRAASGWTALPDDSGDLGPIYNVRVLSPRPGQIVRDATGATTATITSVRISRMDALGALVRIYARSAGPLCGKPLPPGKAQVRVTLRYTEVIPNFDCRDLSSRGALGVLSYAISCRHARQLAGIWARACHGRSCAIHGYRCRLQYVYDAKTSKPEGVIGVYCQDGLKGAAWSISEHRLYRSAHPDDPPRTTYAVRRSVTDLMWLRSAL
jgi:hypothetical protein